jgi:chaperonin cofactor prefoldin
VYSLTKDQKISNLREQLSGLKIKKENIEKQIQGIEAKLTKLESSSAVPSRTKTAVEALDDINF